MRHFPTKWFFLILVFFLYSCTSQGIGQTVTPSQSPTDATAEEVIYSPDGYWVARRFIGHSSTNFDRIEIQDVNGSVFWNIPFEGVILDREGDVWREIPPQGEQWKGDPNPGIHILEWSHDSHYLYFFVRYFADGYQPLMDKFDLQRIDVNSGHIEKVLPGTGDMDFSFSPNQEYLVYTRGQDMPRRIAIRNISTGEEQSISLSPEWNRDLDIGGFDWSPYSDYELRFYTFKEERFQVYYLNIQKLSTKLVFEFWIEDYWNDVWLPDNILRYKTLPENEITEVDIAMPTPRVIGTATIAPTP